MRIQNGFGYIYTKLRHIAYYAITGALSLIIHFGILRISKKARRKNSCAYCCRSALAYSDNQFPCSASFRLLLIHTALGFALFICLLVLLFTSLYTFIHLLSICFYNNIHNCFISVYTLQFPFSVFVHLSITISRLRIIHSLFQLISTSLST